jgi:hypothetical protein
VRRRRKGERENERGREEREKRRGIRGVQLTVGARAGEGGEGLGV